MTKPVPTGHLPAYGEILHLDEFLELACVHDTPDRTLFFAAHQSCEIWFAVVLRHLEQARDALTRDDGLVAVALLDRLPHLMRVVAEHFAVLMTLTPQSFDEIRATLGTSSGFQSAQYREIEFLCGARDPRFLNISGLNDGERARLVARLDEKSLGGAFVEYRARVGADAVEPGFLVERVHTALSNLDDSVRAWRALHAELAEKLLGGAQGTAGSSGAAYLWRSTRRTLFPEVFPQHESGDGEDPVRGDGGWA
ncbi:tryptophan 2,3-dioxygenase [Actinokineospora alba]|uniref:Tryptophan 2,3-dioxygenase n=1 Tax=Actinokineospora alba TaxID=504798 RepID=A0A1H0FWU8_9PSEU|nr:tryptophan 2,3-dioxygenase family protein [Actinokineospora alba]TDP69657.1 tryptophan 2,3-dioxygenase [Actinokineospora alba]SDI11881.1 tryptophan 2,3-dioxygenase [Actinokineospora alba]SDN99093.1 tryptophan 2,3-dioxygenase [Actinokineospora alba]